MPKTIPAPKTTPELTVPDPRTDPKPERVHTGPLSWALGGAAPARQKAGHGPGERRREPAPNRQPGGGADVRRRHNPGSRFRG
ncbi:hypothetical protein [Nannocystis sp. SCPEA4]|uniref:hypothetical protein n=1 Tax=Nannocystis sp. SCPEA4 TaxID=2996787 RepID=UPI00226DC559|nr:hypothetical protein [Nannocystis sp. SCPEA4]MCY1056236.1 hypothetical protein [Nannocystis sp. SCPEA4]